MAGPSRLRADSRPGALGVLLLVGTLALAAVLGWQATGAAASHRRSAEEMLRDYAAVAAWEYAREGRIWLSFGMAEADNLLSREIPTDASRPLPGPDLLRRVLAEKDCDCMSAGFARTVFRVTTGPGADLVADGEPLPAATREALLARVAADTVPRVGPRRWQMLPPGEPGLARSDDVILLWKTPAVPSETREPPRVVYGMVVEAAQVHRPLEGAAGAVVLLPPTLADSAAVDSLVTLTVSGPSGVVVYASDTVSAGSFSATDTLGWMYGDLVARATVRPGAASLLVAGGMPPARTPVIAALMVLTLALGTGALLLLRREQQLARLRDDFVSGVSHELRTPLTQIRVMSELLADGGFRSAAEETRAREVVRREALRLSNLVDNVLQFGRLRRAPGPVTPRPVAVGEVIEETREAFAPLLATHGVTLEVAGGDGHRVAADRDALAQILRNLVENAVKYGPDGQTLRVRLDGAPSRVRIAVEDQGPGVPVADRERIWRPYQRLARDRNAPAGGSGLGLSVVAELTARYGGRAWVEDAPGGGARFVVELPAAGGVAP